MASHTADDAAANAALVERFYSAVAERDADALGQIIDLHFADDAAIEWPPTLPYGGRVEGAARLRKLFAGMALAPVPVGPTNLRVDGVTADAVSTSVELAFDYVPPSGGASISSGAIELWSFNAGRVQTIRAYYWDTAALLPTVPTAP